MEAEVLEHRQIFLQAVLVTAKGDVTALLERQGIGPRAAPRDETRGGGSESGQYPKQGRLARTIWTYHESELLWA
jgi:hypothetical protein